MHLHTLTWWTHFAPAARVWLSGVQDAVQLIASCAVFCPTPELCIVWFMSVSCQGSRVTHIEDFIQLHTCLFVAECMRVCRGCVMCMYMHAHMHVCVCVRACVRACVRVCVCVHVWPIDVHASLQREQSTVSK